MNCTTILFSPTGGTRKVAEILAGAWGGAGRTIDLTDGGADFDRITLDPQTVSLILAPSYAGRAPTAAVERLRRIHGGGSPAVLVCVYGNRAYEDTLAELEDTAAEAGFQVVAAVAAVAEHSIVRRVAAGRPDAADRARLQQMAETIRAKLDAGERGRPMIPGHRPYKKGGVSRMVPAPTPACTRCGLCAARCPVGAIDPQDLGRVNADACLCCMRCVAVCPHGARRVDAALLAALGEKLGALCARRREPELYL